ncbi:MAG: hypothetical protein ACYC8S_01195 [Minisyncoccota bacterium]
MKSLFVILGGFIVVWLVLHEGTRNSANRVWIDPDTGAVFDAQQYGVLERKFGRECAQTMSEDDPAYTKLCVESIANGVMRDWFTLADVGMDGVQLAKLQKNAGVAVAKMWLRYARSGWGDINLNLELFRDEIGADGLTLAEVGTTKEELAELARKGIRAMVQKPCLCEGAGI